VGFAFLRYEGSKDEQMQIPVAPIVRTNIQAVFHFHAENGIPEYFFAIICCFCSIPCSFLHRKKANPDIGYTDVKKNSLTGNNKKGFPSKGYPIYLL
jgi:hypothetical protein